MNKLKDYTKKIVFKLFLTIRFIVYLLLLSFDRLTNREKPSVVILTYHSIDNDGWRFSVDLRTIKKQIDYLLKNYEIVNLYTVEKFIKGKKEVKRPSVVLTFDDGYKDILKLKNYFKKQSIKPALFLVADTKHINKKEIGNRKPFLDKKGIKSLVAEGWEIGSHSNTHSDLSILSKSSLENEIINSKKRLEKEIGIKIRYFAYPRGKYTKKVLALVKKVKYDLGLTMDDGFIKKNINPLIIPRVGIDGTHSFLEFKSAFSPTTISFRKYVKSTFVGSYL